MSSAKSFFTDSQKELIVKAIGDAELRTSGEIRVHLEDDCPGDPVEAAIKVFSKLGMEKTELKNGVLFYLAVADRKFAIIGDSGIDAVVPENFWHAIKVQMTKDFAEQNFSEGLCKGILEAGEQLKAHFPRQSTDKDELTNEVSHT